MVDGSSLLLDLDGVVVESTFSPRCAGLAWKKPVCPPGYQPISGVQRLGGGTRLVQVSTAPDWVVICPECGERSSRSKGWVCTAPRNAQVGPDRPVLRWRKRKWLCPSTVCERTVIDWLAERDAGWRAAITHLAIDLSVVYARAVRLGLPGAIVIVDRFHLVKKANDMVDAVRRRVTLAQRGRRGRKADVEWINRRRLLRGAERFSAEQRDTLFAKLLKADPGEDIAAAGIAKELLRELLSCAERGGLRYEIRAALDRFYRFCAACKVPEVIKFARAIEAWQDPVIAALQTGLTNARTEGYNRIVKHVGRIAFGFRNPANQRRRVRWACTRRSRQVTPSRHQCH